MMRVYRLHLHILFFKCAIFSYFILIRSSKQQCVCLCVCEHVFDTDFVGEKMVQNMPFRHEKYNKNGDWEWKDHAQEHQTILPKGSNSQWRLMHKAWNNPKSTGNAGIFLKTRTLAHPLNPGTALSCASKSSSPPHPPGICGHFFVANGWIIQSNLLNQVPKLDAKHRRHVAGRILHTVLKFPANSSVQSYSRV